MATVFISDLHLERLQSDSAAAFFRFVETVARDAERLYILGDLFEVWIGDDEQTDLGREVAVALRKLADRGTAISFMAGNRDFLLGEDYASRAGMQLLADPTLIQIDNEPVLLCHGDTLCTDDTAYQAFRQEVRQPAWQQHFLAQPLAARQAFAEDARIKSQKLTAGKPPDIMDVNPASVVAAMKQHGVRTMIHGHTHRPADHSLELDGQPARRIVMGAWHDHAEIAVADQRGLRLVEFSL